MSSVCVGCGLCCDGTMYKSVDLEKNDARESLAETGLPLITQDEITLFRQPCAAFGDACCKIYEIRPSVCRWYRCLLLRRLEGGEIPERDARALIAKTTALRDRVRSGLTRVLDARDRASLGELYRRLLAKLDDAPDPAAARRELSDLLLDVVALRVVLAREFEPRDAASHAPDIIEGTRPAAC